MRNPRLSVLRVAGCAVTALFIASGTTAVQADPPPLSTALVQVVVPPTESWEDHARELIRRTLERLGGNAIGINQLPVKSAVSALSLQFTLFGIPSGLNADEITQLEADAAELAGCADWDPGPPEGTSYSLIVQIHDLGKAIYTAAELY